MEGGEVRVFQREQCTKAVKLKPWQDWRIKYVS